MKRAIRRSYSDNFRQKALQAAEEIGIGAAAAKLKVRPSVIYRWKKKGLFSPKAVVQNATSNNGEDLKEAMSTIKVQRSELEKKELYISKLERLVGRITIENRVEQ